MIRRWLFLVLVVSGCNVQVYNSSTSDKSRYGGNHVGDGTPGGARFAAAYAVMQTNCFSCHNEFGEYTNEQDWINENLVVAGDLAGSELYARLKGAEVAGAHDMPDDNPALSSVDLSTIRDWITQIGQ